MVVGFRSRALWHPGIGEWHSDLAGDGWMNKAEIADRLAARTGLSKGAARDAVDAVDGVFATIGEALANGEEVR